MIDIGGFTLEEIGKTVNETTEGFAKAIQEMKQVKPEGIQLLTNNDKCAGYLVLYSTEYTDLLLTLRLSAGSVIMSLSKYLAIAYESAKDLCGWPDYGSSYFSSKHKTGDMDGAVVAGKYIVSFAGFPSQHYNETLSMLIAMKLGWLEENNARKIAGASGNKLFEAVARKMGFIKKAEVVKEKIRKKGSRKK